MDLIYDIMDLTVALPPNNSTHEKNLLKNFYPENGRHLLLSILNTDIGKIYSDFNSTVVENVELHIFERFLIRHKSMQYSRVFQQTNLKVRDKYFQKSRKIKDKIVHHYTEDKKCKGQIHPAQIQEGFRTILFRVVSQELVGSNRNKKKILKTLQNLLKTARTESYSLQNLLKRLDISSMKWLNGLSSIKEMYILAAKFIKWLFHYFIEVINFQFRITNVKEEKIYIFIKDWNSQNNQEIKNLVKKMVLKPYSKVGNNANTGNNLCIIPKTDSVRFVVRNNYTDAEKDKLRKVMGVLRYLYDEHFKIKDNDFQKFYPDVCKTFKNSKSFYVISADIHDAFGSVKQDKLYDIIQVVFESLPVKIDLQLYKLRGSNRYKYHQPTKINPRYKKYTYKTVRIEKSYLLEALKDYIFNTKVTVSQKIFKLIKGLGQGLMLSPILCDIYYAHMTKKCFSYFILSGFLFTYVDDSFYITDDQHIAEKYIDIIKNGIPEYNCWFNKSKLQSNLETSDKLINYLGWQIDPKILEITPKYLPARKNTIFMNLSKSTLESKIENLTPLKLSKIIFSKQINSSERIFKNIEIVALQQARRCYTLTRSISESKSKLSTKMIRKANFKIIKKIESLAGWSPEERFQHRQRLRYILWKSFFSVFNKHSSFKNLTMELKKLTKKYKLFTKRPKPSIIKGTIKF